MLFITAVPTVSSSRLTGQPPHLVHASQPPQSGSASQSIPIVVVGHLQPDPLVAAFNIESFVGLGAVEYCLRGNVPSAVVKGKRKSTQMTRGWGAVGASRGEWGDRLGCR